MPLFIDAYNLIHAAMRRLPGFEIKGGDTQSARDSLLDLLAKFRAVKPDRIVVFFDGGPDAQHLPRHALARGMEIQFSDADADADTDIKHAVSRSDAPRSIRVVSSDTAIQVFVKRYGAKVIDSGSFLREIADVLEDQSIPADEPIEKYEGAQSDDETEYWLGVFGEEFEDESE